MVLKGFAKQFSGVLGAWWPMATAPEGSAVAPAAGDGSPPAGGFFDMNVAMRMVAAAEAAAEAARAATSLASRSTSDENKSWWKLLPKPSVFDHSTRESEIAAWKDWSWNYEQYLASIDARFADDIQQVRSHPEQVVDPVDFFRQREAAKQLLLQLVVFTFAAESFDGGSAGVWIKWFRSLQDVDSAERTLEQEQKYGTVECHHELAYVLWKDVFHAAYSETRTCLCRV